MGFLRQDCPWVSFSPDSNIIVSTEGTGVRSRKLGIRSLATSNERHMNPSTAWTSAQMVKPLQRRADLRFSLVDSHGSAYRAPSTRRPQQGGRRFCGRWSTPCLLHGRREGASMALGYTSLRKDLLMDMVAKCMHWLYRTITVCLPLRPHQRSDLVLGFG